MNEQLIQIHNALCEINTKGEDTITMARCLVTLRQVINDLQEEEKEETVNGD